jgi:polysaccharide pyruvyl transferase WcaK-like protein
LLSTLRTLRDTVSNGFDTDRALQASMAGFIEASASRYALDPGDQWRPGKPLKLLLAGYTGTRNTGADVRVEEMIRQFRHLLGDDLLDLSILTLDPDRSRGYFRTVKQLHMPKIFPKFIFDTVHQVHGVVACEGSMFKSKFANALATLMVGALGTAVAENKIAIGYGGEAGNMDPSLEDLVRRYCRSVLILTRNEASSTVLDRLGVASRPGTDTAWTFDPAPPAVGRQMLLDAGWDGVTPVLALCPIHPFWWPVKPDVTKSILRGLTGAHAQAHYDSVYFHKEGREVDDAYRTYLAAWVQAVRRFRAHTPVFPIVVAMERLDADAARKVAAELNAPTFLSEDVDMYELVSAIRQARYMVTSRYHAAVTTMPAQVCSIGVTMDERLRNLMADRGTPDLCLEVDDPGLAEHMHDALVRVRDDEATLRDGIAACVIDNLERMGRMGMHFVDHLRQRHPNLPIDPRFGSHGEPWDHLPSLPPAVLGLLAETRGAA